MSTERTAVVTGSASGMGAATARRLRDDGWRVIGVDRAEAEVCADLGTPEGRASAIAAVEGLVDGSLDALVTWAGLGGLPGRDGSLLASVNYFGTVALLEGLRPLLAAGSEPTAVAIASNSMTCMPGVPLDVTEACLSGDEAAARAAADASGSITAYPATKLAVTRWCRHHAPGPDWAGAGIRLNVLAPGAVETPLLAATKADPVLGPLFEGFPVPIGRNGAPEELAGTVAFLLGPDARFFVGAVLTVDGGTEAQLRADEIPSPWAP